MARAGEKAGRLGESAEAGALLGRVETGQAWAPAVGSGHHRPSLSVRWSVRPLMLGAASVERAQLAGGFLRRRAPRISRSD
ncbi:hypothetical protein ACRAWG_16330 [Methylobacterium sp. P31]